MIIASDMHTHTTFSPDGHDTPDAMCAQALVLGLREIAFTEHVEWQPAARFRPDFARYFDAVAACRERYGPQGLRVLTGVEIGNPHDYPQRVEALLRRHDFDVVVLSLHWLSGRNIQGPRCFAGNDPAAVYSAYFTNLAYVAALARTALPVARTTIAHFDRIFWTGVQAGCRPDLARLEPVVRAAWQVVAGSGVALELNTRLLDVTPGWRRELVTLLRWFREAGGWRVVVNSDAHRKEEVALGFGTAVQLLREAGLTGHEEPVAAGNGPATWPARVWTQPEASPA